MLLYHKKYNYSIKLLKKTFVNLNSLEVCSFYPYIYFYRMLTCNCVPANCVSIIDKCNIFV